MLNKVKKITAGVDTKMNPALTLHEQIMSFFTIKQGRMEADDDYLNRFDSGIKNTEMAGGEYLLCIPQLTVKKLNDTSEYEVNAEKERFRAKYLFLRSD